MLERLFGWSKASKCKSLVRTVINRVKLLRNKRSIKIKQAREDIAQLLGNGQYQNCFKRVDFLFQEQNLLDGYDMVVKFCECFLERLSYIRRHKDRPEDINEAVSSLIYASARCADLPELLRLRSLLAKRYGYEFASAAVYLHHDSCVNQQIIEKLSDRFPALDFKLKLVQGIAVEFNLQWDSSIIEVEFGEPTTDSLGGSGGSEKFNTENSKSCQNGVDSSFHPSCNNATYVDSTSIQFVNDGSSNVNEFSDSIKKQRRASFNDSNEKSALHVGCEDQIFERDISVVSGSVKEKFVETSSLKKTERFPGGIGLTSSYSNVGPRSNGHGFVKASSFDSCSIDNHHFDNLGYNNGSAAEPAGGATSRATKFSKISKSSMEVKHSDSLLDYTENEEDVSDKNMLHQSDTMPLPSKHSRWVHTAENGHNRIQTCSPERSEVLVDRNSELSSARYTSPSKSKKTKPMQTSSDCYGEKQGVHNYPKVYVNTRRSSPRSNTDVKKVGDGIIEFDGHRWCSAKHKDTKRDIERLVIVDDTEVSEIYPEGWTMKDKGCYFKDYIEVDVRSRLGDRLQHQNSSRTRKKIRREARRRHSISSHHPVEINSLYPHGNNSADNTVPVSNRSGHFKTFSSKNENREGVFYPDDFVKTEGGVTIRKYSDCGSNIRVMAQPLFEDKVRSVSSNGHRTSYDMIDSYIDSDSDVEISIIPQNIYQVRDYPSPGHVQLHGKKTIQRGKKENEHNSFEEEHGIRKIYNKDESNVGKQRSDGIPNGFQLSENDEMLIGTYSSRKQIFYPSKENHIAKFMRDQPCGLQQNGDEATLRSPDDSGEDMLDAIDKTYTSSSVGMHPYELQQHGGDSTLHSLDVSQSPKNNDHHENNDADVEQNFHQSLDTRQWSSPTLTRHSKSQETHCKGGKTLENKPQKGRKKSPNFCQKDHYDCDIDSSDSEDQYARQSHATRKVQKAAHLTNSESVQRSFDDRFHDKKRRGGSSKLLEENCEEPEFGGNIYDNSTARRIGNFCSPRVSFVYIDRPGKAQQQPSSMCYMEENKSDQACIERHRVHRTDSLPTKERQQSNGANIKKKNSTCDLARDELKNSLNEACNTSKSRNPPSTADQVESQNQHVCEEKSSMGEISTSLMHQSTNFVKRNSEAASVGTPRRPPLSPATPSLSSGFRSCGKPFSPASPSSGKPFSPASPSTRPPQRPPPKLPCKWERAISLPPQRSNASPVTSAVRSQSLQTNLSKETTSYADSPRTLHVHPKLPEYDDLAAKFMAMKEHHRAITASE